MKINDYLNARALPSLDDQVLEAIEEFINGTHMAIVHKSVEGAERHNAWLRENILTKREQLAGHALIGLAPDDYMDTDNIVKISYEIADKMMEKNDDTQE